MEDSCIAILKENLSIEQALETIGKYENNMDLSASNPVKWKSYSYQVVVETNSYFYKIYENDEDGIGPINSRIRAELANVYSNLGIEWNVISYSRDGNIYDFEQRQKLKVASQEDTPFGELLLNFSYILDEVEDALEFRSILQQLKAHSIFSDVCQLKLVRQCINKYEDYAIYGNHAILLDDAEFYIALADEQGRPVKIPNPHSFPVSTSYGNFLFTNCNRGAFQDGEESMKLPPHYEITHGWFLFKQLEKEEASNKMIERRLETDNKIVLRQKKVLMNDQISEVKHKALKSSPKTTCFIQTTWARKLFNGSFGTAATICVSFVTWVLKTGTRTRNASF